MYIVIIILYFKQMKEDPTCAVSLCRGLMWSIWSRAVLDAGLSRSGQRQGGRQTLLVSALEEPSSRTLLDLQEYKDYKTPSRLLLMRWTVVTLHITHCPKL